MFVSQVDKTVSLVPRGSPYTTRLRIISYQHDYCIRTTADVKTRKGSKTGVGVWLVCAYLSRVWVLSRHGV